MSGLLQSVFSDLQRAAETGEKTTGISTGYERFDAKTAGLHDGDLTIVAARPGMGKTAFVMNLAVNVASPTYRNNEIHHPGHGVGVFSLEMPKKQLASRMACSEGRVDLEKMRHAMLQTADWTKLAEASAFLTALPIWIDDTPGLTLLGLRAKARRMQAEAIRMKRPLKLIVIDYLQLMAGRPDAASREQGISELSRGLKKLAKELSLPIIALSQLNRAVETRSTKDKRPQLSDLRESGSIEQDADCVVFIFREDYYNDKTDLKGIAELIIAKQRNGPTGKVMVRFAASYTRFDNLAHGDYPEMADE